MTRYFLGLLAMLWVCACGPAVSEDPEILARLPDKVDYNYHIKPLLSDRCFACHGPDENKREAGLRLDTQEGAFAALTESEGFAIVPGNLSRSAVYHRITADDPEYVMPTPESNLSLDDYEIALINKWIDQGAEWKKHWAFIPPQKADPPHVKDPDWVRQPIDQFVRHRLEKEGIQPSPEASKERLLRRVYLDLTGLAPDLESIDAFLADDSPDAYENVVDQLLQSDEYAERMTMEWLDVARYADSHGMHADGWRSMWPWRDWVIKAFQENMPYDEFIRLQLAGDLLPEAKRNQILATAFNRNHPMTAEGGVVDEEFRLKYVFDRTNTTATAFLGLTLECAQCHDHKFDPISQKEYYQVSAFFNNIRELGMTGDDGNYGPMLRLPDPQTEKQLADLNQEIASEEQRLALTEQEIASRREFLEKVSARTSDLKKDLLIHLPLERMGEGRNLDGKQTTLIDGRRNASLTGEVELVEGKKGKAFRVDTEFESLYLHKMGDFESWQAFSSALWARTEKTGEPQTLLGNTGSKNQLWRGWEFFLDSANHLSIRIVHSLPHDYIQITSLDTIPQNQWHHLAFSYDGSGKAEGLRLYIDGQKAKVEVDYDRLTRTIYPVGAGLNPRVQRAVRMGRAYRAFTGEYGIFLGRYDEVYLYQRELSALEVAQLAEVEVEPTEKEKARHYALLQSRETEEIRQGLAQLRQEREAIRDTVLEVMVMEEMPQPRTTYVLNRGSYDQPQAPVGVGTPASVLPFPEDLPRNRLGLAQWLVDRQNPLTARVTVNRYWQMLFGQGLVKTPDDFGNQGALPTHPELLDWLAVDFVENGWDVRELLRTMVLSATYRQDSKYRDDLQELDPNNDLLARGPAFRLSAEMIRDNALAASGLLVKKIGGPSVKPYQPKGLWIDKGTFSAKLLRYQPDSGQALYRRSMYTFIKRTSPHPAMAAFDAPDRSVCTVKRENTNTPLQALVLLNDPQFVEAARVMAERMQKEGGTELEGQLAMGLRWATSRQPSQEELQILVEQYEAERAHFAQDASGAEAMLAVGEAPREEGLAPDHTAALAVVASTILNMDDAYMKR
jgi:hypothetical protein